MNVVAFLVANAQTTLFEDPGKTPFDDTTMLPQSTAMLGVAFGDERFDAALAQRLSKRLSRA